MAFHMAFHMAEERGTELMEKGLIGILCALAISPHKEGGFFLAKMKDTVLRWGCNDQDRERVEGHQGSASPCFGSG